MGTELKGKAEGFVHTGCLVLSALPHTWLIDIDGTLAVHNGYRKDGADTPLTASLEFMGKIPGQDMVILLTSRTEEFRGITEDFLRRYNIRYDRILFGLPMGERILINDDKPSGLGMSYAVQLERDAGIQLDLHINEEM